MNGAPRIGRRLCAIHQPNFFPWLGYFDKIARADVFVFLDDVAYPRSGSGMGSWTNRVRIDVGGKPHWVGCPVRRMHGPQPIREARIAPGPWRERLIRTLEMNYRRAPGFDRAIAALLPLIHNPTDLLAEFNIHAVTALCRELGIAAEFRRQSDMGVSGAGTRLLIELVRAAGSKAYLCGGGTAGYQQDELFPAHGLELVHQDFSPQPYGDPARFLPGLSVIDFMMHSADWRVARPAA
jgi:hypothetical protein